MTLEGEAFFKVNYNPDKPFIVYTGSLKVTVLGTSFNIKTFEDENIEVTVAIGKVQVQAEYNEAQQAHVSPVALAKGEQAIYSTAGQHPEKTEC